MFTCQSHIYLRYNIARSLFVQYRARPCICVDASSRQNIRVIM